MRDADESSGGSRYTRRRVLQTTAIGGSLSLAGCFDDGSGNGDGNGGGTITLGTILPLSGAASFVGTPMEQGLRLGVADVGEFEVDGATYSFGLDVNDDQCASESAISITNRLINQQNLGYILGPLCSQNVRATIPVTQEAGVLQSTLDGLRETACASEHVVKNTNIFISSAEAISNYVIEEISPAKVTTLTDANHATLLNTTDTLVPRLLDDAGVDTQSVTYERGAGDFASTIENIKQYGPDLVIGGGLPSDYVTIIEQARNLDLTVPIYASMSTNEGSVLDQLDDPDVLEGVHGWTIMDTPALVNQVEHDPAIQLAQKFQAEYDTGTGFQASSTYDLPFILSKAMQVAGSVDPMEVARQVPQLTNEHIYDEIDWPTGGPTTDYIQLERGSIFDENGQVWVDTTLSSWENEGGNWSFNFDQILEPPSVPNYHNDVFGECAGYYD